MKTFFTELFEYNHHFNQQLAEILLKNSEIVSQKATELFSHSLNAHQIWNSRILSTQKPFGVWEVHEPENYKIIDENNYENSLAIISSHDLKEIVNYQNSRGDKFENSIRDILFHITNHSTYHRAQIATELKVKEIQPPLSDWILYKR